MPKTFRNIILFIGIAWLFYACQKTDFSAGSLSILPDEIQMTPDEVRVLSLLWNGDTLSNGKAQWSSSDENIVYVSGGIVQARQIGESIVKASYQSSTAECIVIVSGQPKEPAEDLSNAVRYLSKSAKRGVGYNFAQFPTEDVSALAPYISWCYNWGLQPSSEEISHLLGNAGIEYIPMAWNGANEAQIRTYKQSHPQCEYILAFNEPNLTDQANMTPQQAAEKWPALKTLAGELNLKIVSPAMNYGTLAGYSDPEKWLDEFFALVPKTDMCAIALHCYMGSAGAMYNYIHKFDKYDMPIWMTEFCSWDRPAPSSVDAQIDYMNEAVVMLEADSNVERYAWFIPRANGAVNSYPYMQLLSKTDIGALSQQGEVYAGISSFDKNVWLPTDAPILPNTYSNCSAKERIESGGFEAAPHLRPTTDNAGTLMMTGLTNGKWVEYQIEATHAIEKCLIRFQGVVGSTITILVDGQEILQADIPWNDMQWSTLEIPLTLEQGRHTIRLVSGGNITFNWLKFL
ncbi:MAG: hypothetical protein IKO26_00915 [Paludibacteraceae bacterium]|nr:hypothetical protein [Paludibacteraceae bacterium]